MSVSVLPPPTLLIPKSGAKRVTVATTSISDSSRDAAHVMASAVAAMCLIVANTQTLAHGVYCDTVLPGFEPLGSIHVLFHQKRLLQTPQEARPIGVQQGDCQLRCKTAHAFYSEILPADIAANYGRVDLQAYVDLGHGDARSTGVIQNEHYSQCEYSRICHRLEGRRLCLFLHA